MSLPIITSPKYTLDIPSTGVAIEYRPFLVKEEKVLLIAQESQEQSQIMTAIKDVIRACTYGKIDPDALASYDLEYIFIKLRAKSVGEISTVGIKCSECDAVNNVDIDLDKITVSSALPESKIQLTDSIGVSMKPMNMKDLSRIASKKNVTAADQMIDSVIACIEHIYDSTTIYLKENSTRAELESFIGSLSRAQMQKIESFIMNLPKVEHTVEFKCSKCKHDNTHTISGVQAFFG
jgi:phage FluMu protein Com